MSEWQKIESAPKDGTMIILFGGETDEDDYLAELGNLRRRQVVAAWKLDGWVFSYWDGAWRCEYINPTHWMPLPSAPA